MRFVIPRSRSRRLSRGVALAIPALLGWGGPSAAADLVRVERLGEVEVRSSPGDLRRAALEAGIGQCVLEVAREIMNYPPEGDLENLREALGPEMVVYADRFRVLEDRGISLNEEPEATPSEPESYTVLVEVYVDRDRVEHRLSERGMLAFEEPEFAASQITVEVGLSGSYEALETLTVFLAGSGGVQSVVPREFEPGRARFRVETRGSAEALASRILRFAPIELPLRSVRVREGVVWIDLD